MTIFRIILMFALLITAQSCASRDNVQPSSPEEKDIAASALKQCLESNVADLDDGISDASTIANALARRCYYDFESLAAMYVDHESSQRVRQMALDEIRQTYSKTALQFVLRYRTRNQVR